MTRKNIAKIAILSFSFILLISACGPEASSPYTEFYVSVLGSDSSGDGSESSPWRHVQYALDNLDYSVDPAPRLNLLKGIYNEEITVTQSIVIKGAGEWGPAAVFPDNEELPTTDVSMLVRVYGLAGRGHFIQGSGIDVNISDVVFQWGGVHVLDGARATFDHVQFSNVINLYGLNIENSSAFAVRDSEFRTQPAVLADIGINVRDSIGVIERTYLGDTFDHPISIARYPNGAVTVVTIDDVDIEGSTIWYADGIRMFGRPSVTITNSTIRRLPNSRNEAWRETVGGDSVAAGIGVQNTTDGLSSNQIELLGNTISGFHIGVSVDIGGYGVKAENNDISGLGHAVSISNNYDRTRSPGFVDFGGGSKGSIGGNTFNPPEFGFTFFVDDDYDLDACFNDWVVPDSSVDPTYIWDKLDESFRGRVYWDVCAREAIEADSSVPTLAAIPPDAVDEEGEPSATATRNGACREGADPAFDVVNFLFEGETANVIGRMTEATWFYVELPNELGRCWIFGENVELSGPIASLLLYTPPELPAAEEGSGDDGGDEGGGSGGNDSGGGDGGGSGGNDGGGGGSAPDAPSNVSYQCSGGSFEFSISWNDNSDNENGFRILRDGSEVGTVGSNVNQFTHNPGGSGPYSLTVEAYNGNGTSSAALGNVGCLP